MLQFVQSPTHLSHITLSQPFRIKCERYIFLKKCVCSLLLILFPHVYVYGCICITAMQHTYVLNNPHICLCMYWMTLTSVCVCVGVYACVFIIIVTKQFFFVSHFMSVSSCLHLYRWHIFQSGQKKPKY